MHSGLPKRMTLSLTSDGWTGILFLVPSGSSSVVEHRLAKARVASSNLVSRSNPNPGTLPDWLSRIGSTHIVSSPAKARYPSGKGEVCKTFMRRFDPGPRLQKSSTT